MAKYIIRFQSMNPDAKLIFMIKKLTGLGIAEIKERIVFDKPLAEYLLPSADQTEETKILQLVNLLETTGKALSIYEVDENIFSINWNEISDNQISIEILKNIIETDKLILEEIEESDDLRG